MQAFWAINRENPRERLLVLSKSVFGFIVVHSLDKSQKFTTLSEADLLSKYRFGWFHK